MMYILVKFVNVKQYRTFSNADIKNQVSGKQFKQFLKLISTIEIYVNFGIISIMIYKQDF